MSKLGFISSALQGWEISHGERADLMATPFVCLEALAIADFRSAACTATKTAQAKCEISSADMRTS